MPLARRYAKLLKESSVSRFKFVAEEQSFPLQAACIQDESTFVNPLCGRRAGKTEGAIRRWNILRQRKPGCESVFIALTGKSAKAIAWRILKKINHEQRLGLKFNEAELTASDAQGSVLRLVGANREDLLDSLRGRPFLFVAIDEAAFYRLGLLRRLLDDVVEPALVDHRGQVWVMGTPGLTKTGEFYRICTSKSAKWSHHHWTMRDNPFLPDADAWLRAKMEQEGWTATSPTYLREYLGEWVNDAFEQVYPIDDCNVVASMPNSWSSRRADWITALGIDYGVRNATTHALLAYSRFEHCVYVVDSRRDVGMLPTEANEVTKRWQERWNPTVTVGDSGGLGKVYVQYSNTRGGLAVNVENAKKLDKRGHQEWLRDALLARPKPRFVIVDTKSNRELIQEMTELQWEPFAAEDPRYHTREDPRGKKDLCDAALYAFVECHAYFPQEVEEKEKDPDDLPRETGMEYLA